MRLSVSEAISALRGSLVVPPADPGFEMTSVTWDSRMACPGCAFLAIPGERVDGNDYIVQAMESGAALAIATSEVTPEAMAAALASGAAIVRVDDHIEAMTRLASRWREELSATVVGVTGSNGKTTTKDMIAQVLGSRFSCVSTLANQNNELGVPATVLAAERETETLVVEMGMRGMGQIESLCAFARPHIGVVTNIGTAHEELLGSRENIARAKAELIASLPDGHGVAVLGGDDPMTPFLREISGADARGIRTLTFGISDGCAVRGFDVEFCDTCLPTFSIEFPDGRVGRVTIPLRGMHNVMNALAAASVGYALDIPIERICNALAGIGGQKMRQQVTLASAGYNVIDDTYNASPDSMSAALTVLQMMKTPGRRVAVLGDMGELGERSEELHREVGEMVVERGVDLLVTVGTLSKSISAGAMDRGLAEGKAIECDDVDDAIGALRAILEEGDTVLVKASRFMGFERIVKGLVD